MIAQTAQNDERRDDPRSIAELQDRYLQLLRVELPNAAKQERWIIRFDHCFMRIILDRLFGDRWYDHLDRKKPAYKQLNERQLRSCILMAESILQGPTELLLQWNQDSLRWRGKLS